MSENKLVYICSPYAGDVEKNVEFAKMACRYAIRQNCTPVAVHLLYPQLLNIPVKEIPESEIKGGFSMKQYGVWAVRSANSVCGAAQSWCKHNGEPIKFDTYEQAAAHAKSLNDNAYSPNVHYYPKGMEIESEEAPFPGMKLRL